MFKAVFESGVRLTFLVRRLRRCKPSNRGSRASGCFRSSI